jgi:AcrR family transcriptional regulator
VPRRSDEFKADRREELVAAAARCFVRDGYDRTTMRQIAAEAGLSTGAIYTYFQTKATLLDAVCQHAAATRQAAARAALATAPPAGDDRVVAAYTAALSPFLALPAEELRQRERSDLLLWYEATRDPEVAASVRQLIASWRGMVLHLLYEERAAGRLRDDLDLQALTALLEALPIGLELYELLGGAPLDWASAIRTLGAVLRQGAMPAEPAPIAADAGSRRSINVLARTPRPV